ncbi:DUF6230 family protein [Gryllotalpicola ginsengisoli]|uniref:DUF6230 family protein n=1 Tax=Gryllotalpicola ginsengisoli TaxID=444608 RepID=UPI0003B4E635|nr:DUF6230 family protein [Gryllotalpicola ginsengisoli]
MKLSKMTRSRGGRIALAGIPVGIVAAVLMGGVAQGAVPVSFSISGTSFTMAGTELDGTSFSQYGGIAKMKDGKETPVAIANIGHATIANLCQAVQTDSPLGKVGIVITAGQDKPVEATDLQIGMTDLQGNAVFKNVRIGTDAASVVTDAKGSAGDFAQDSDGITLTDFKQVAYSTTAATLALTGMHMKVVTDGSGC